MLVVCCVVGEGGGYGYEDFLIGEDMVFVVLDCGGLLLGVIVVIDDDGFGCF